MYSSPHFFFFLSFFFLSVFLYSILAATIRQTESARKLFSYICNRHLSPISLKTKMSGSMSKGRNTQVVNFGVLFYHPLPTLELCTCYLHSWHVSIHHSVAKLDIELRQNINKRTKPPKMACLLCLGRGSFCLRPVLQIYIRPSEGTPRLVYVHYRQKNKYSDTEAEPCPRQVVRLW